MADRDEDWLDALAGARAPANARQQKEIDALRRAARALDATVSDEMAERRLLDRLEREGLLPSRRRGQRQLLHSLARAAVVVLCLGLVLEWFLFLPPPDSQPPRDKETQAAPPGDAAMPALRPAEADVAGERRSRLEAEDAAPFAAEPSRLKGAAPAPAIRQAPAEALRDSPAAGAAPSVPRLVQVAAPEAASRQLRGLLMQADVEVLWTNERPAAASKQELTEPKSGDQASWRLRCRTAQACGALNAWLKEQGAEPVFEPGRVIELQLDQP